MKKLLKNPEFIKFFTSIIAFALAFLFKENILRIGLFLVSYLIISFDMYKEAIEAFKEKDFFNECSLMILATIGAFYIGEYPEAVMIVLLFEIGEYLSDMAVSKSKDSIVELMDLRCDVTTIKRDGELLTIPSEKVKINDIFVVKPGESVPIDGKLISKDGLLDTSSITGESVPVFVKKNDKILSGTICKGSILEINATSTYQNSTAYKIIELIENSDNKKANAEKLITRFSHIYTPIIVFLALIIVLIPTLMGLDFNTYLYKALIFLVTSCPCALVISIPLSFFAGIGRASREGILFKGSIELEKINNIDCFSFDKTGTITEGKFDVSEIFSVDGQNDKLLEIAAYLEYYSLHPIASSIKSKYNKKIDQKVISLFKDFSGKGVSAKILNKQYYAGNYKFMKSINIDCDEVDSIGTVVYISDSKDYLGYIIISDFIRDDASDTIAFLNNNKYKTIMVSGDNEKYVKNVSELVGINEYHSDLLPVDKVDVINKLQKKNVVAFVGDGLNDAPVLKKADIGISMGGIGVDASLEASDVVLMHDKLFDIKKAISISSLTLRTIKSNIFFALLLKVVMLIFGIIGITSIWGAVIADVGVCLLTIFHSLSLLHRKL